jgi:8-oxo-dGTP diphosphatase
MTHSIRVACALIAENGRLFAAKRGTGRRNAGLWELPGGKLEAGETARACIVRELREELGLAVEPVAEWEPVGYAEPGLILTLIPLVCRRVGGNLVLTEHTETGWFSPPELPGLNWSAADIPVVERWRAEAVKESRP